MNELTAAIRTIVDRHMHAGAIGGAVTLVQKGGERVHLDAQGHADFDPSAMLRTDSIFGIMSMTKPVTATCAMILISEGKIGLDDPVSRYIPAFARPRTVRTLRPGQAYPPFPPAPGTPLPPEPEYDLAPAEREITIRHLLSFTSGLQTIGIPNGMRPIAPEDTLASYIDGLGDVPLEFQPGTRWHYSNTTGYDVLGRVIEIASGRSFQQFATERLFGPLDMRDTQFGSNPDRSARTVPLGPLANEPIVRTDYPSGSGGLFSTITDYASFAQMLLNGGQANGRRILAAEAVAAMHRDQLGPVPFGGIRVADYVRPIHDAPTAFTYGFGVGILAQEAIDEALPAGSYGWDGVGTRRFWVMPALDTVLIMLMPGMGFGSDAAHKEIEAEVVRWAREN